MTKKALSMETFLKQIQIGFLIRSVFSGAFFVIAFVCAITKPEDLFKFDIKNTLEAGLPLSLFCGVVVYAMQRSLFYPVIEWLLEAKWCEKFRGTCPLISRRAIQTHFWRWNITSPESTTEMFNERLTKWADLIHLQYNAFLSIVLGSFAGQQLDIVTHYTCKPLASLAWLLLISALVSNWRHYAFIDAAKADDLHRRFPRTPQRGELPRPEDEE